MFVKCARIYIRFYVNVIMCRTYLSSTLLMEPMTNSMSKFENITLRKLGGAYYGEGSVAVSRKTIRIKNQSITF